MSDSSVFADAREAFEEMLGWLEGAEAGKLAHGDLEGELDARGRELLRLMLQEHLELRSAREARVEVVCVEGVAHRSVETGHARPLRSIFGPVTVERFA